MPWNDQRVFALVPARGGSKGIPRKNLRPVDGVSLIGRAARVARSLPWLDAALISTDDREMAEEGRRYGLEAPFMRPADLANDTATNLEVWRHAWLAAEEHYENRFDLSILLEPTSPLRRPEDVERTVRVLTEGDHGAAATVSRNSGSYTPEKTLLVGEDGCLRHYLPEGRALATRQLIPPYYHRNGVCYAAVRETVVVRKKVIGKDCAAVVIDRQVVNIDEPFEIELAEWLMSRESARG